MEWNHQDTKDKKWSMNDALDSVFQQRNIEIDEQAKLPRFRVRTFLFLFVASWFI
jgi:hypothetical protein